MTAFKANHAAIPHVSQGFSSETQHQLAHLLFEQISDGVALYDGQQIIACNSALRAMFGCVECDLKQIPLSELIIQPDPSDERLLNGQIHAVTALNHAGQPFPMRLRAVQLNDPQQPFYALLLTEPDVLQSGIAPLHSGSYGSVPDGLMANSQAGYPLEPQDIANLILTQIQQAVSPQQAYIKLMYPRDTQKTWFMLYPDDEGTISPEFDQYPLFQALKRQNHHSDQLQWLIEYDKQFIVMPFINPDEKSELLAVMVLQFDQTDRLSASKQRFLSHLSERITLALHNSALYIHHKYRAEQEAVLSHITQGLVVNLDFEKFLVLAVVGLQSLLASTGVIYYKYDSENRMAIPQIDQLEHEASEKLVRFAVHDYPQLLQALRDDYGIFDQDKLNASTPEHQLLKNMQVQSLLVLPVRLNHQLVGILMVTHSGEEHIFDNEEIWLAQRIQTDIVTAIERTQMHETLAENEAVKSEMIRMASHDLRKPLAQVSGFVQLLEGTLTDPLTDDQTLYFDMIKGSLDRAKKLLDNILNLERIESSPLESWMSVDLPELVEEVLAEVDSLVIQKHQQLTADLEHDIPPIIANPVLIRQAVINLVDNAIKYTPEDGAIHVNLRTEGDCIHFEVEDTGYGIPESQQPRIFQRFFRAVAPGTEQISGTGLGLSLVKFTINRHNGEVYFRSQAGEGSLFGFWLPIKK